MKTIKNGIFIASINSPRIMQVLNSGKSLNLTDSILNLDILVFDVLETLNGIFFNNKNQLKQKDDTEKIIDRIKFELKVSNVSKTDILRGRNFKKILNPYLTDVYLEYFSNGSFERHCKNQIFQNLQPKLSKLDIISNKSEYLEILVPYMLNEIAFYLHLFDSGSYDRIYGLEKEMNIICSIKDGKYSSFKKYLNYKTTFVEGSIC